MDISMNKYKPEYLVPHAGRYLVRTVNALDGSIHYFHVVCAKEWNYKLERFQTCILLNKSFFVTHISKTPLS
jgi:hypothetical protein